MPTKSKSCAGAARLVRMTCALLTAAALCACAGSSDGSRFLAEARKAPLPKSGLARIYVYPENGPDNVPIMLDEQLIGEIQAGTYMSREIPAGAHELMSSNSNYPGVTRFRFSAAAGQTYYFKVEPSEGAKKRAKVAVWGTVLGAVPAVTAASVEGFRVAGKEGPVNFVQVSEAAAAPRLSA